MVHEQKASPLYGGTVISRLYRVLNARHCTLPYMLPAAADAHAQFRSRHGSPLEIRSSCSLCVWNVVRAIARHSEDIYTSQSTSWSLKKNLYFKLYLETLVSVNIFSSSPSGPGALELHPIWFFNFFTATQQGNSNGFGGCFYGFAICIMGDEISEHSTNFCRVRFSEKMLANNILYNIY